MSFYHVINLGIIKKVKMATTISNYASIHKHDSIYSAPFSSHHLSKSLTCPQTLKLHKITTKSSTRKNNYTLSPIVSASLPSLALDFDVVIVGAGIIGLTIARQFLKESKLSVAVVDASVPCASGATGAGQGYIWMTGKTPGTELWELGMRSKQLWENLAKGIEEQGFSPLQELGWKKTGSLMIGRSLEELSMLKDRVELLSEAGLRAEFLSRSELVKKEPLVDAGNEGGAAFLHDDCQLDALRTVEFIQKENRSYGSRYVEFFNDPVIDVLRSSGSGEVEGVRTEKNSLYCKKAVVIAAGSWSGSLMKNVVEKFDIVLDVPVKPRKGHLLVIENFNSIRLNHGLMEIGYMDHQVAAPSDSGVVDYSHTMSISMTATLDGAGNLVLGSSRQFVGFNTDLDESIVDRIWKRAGEFIPSLRDVGLEELSKSRKVRVGLRPYMPDGKPIISPVPGVPKVLVAAGHEGAGLTLALGTAEMVFNMLFGNPSEINYVPFSFHGRCCK